MNLTSLSELLLPLLLLISLNQLKLLKIPFTDTIANVLVNPLNRVVQRLWVLSLQLLLQLLRTYQVVFWGVNCRVDDGHL
jgi:hypothetical protein